MLDGVDLVHMNGRVYDPIIGRFMAADPITEAPYSSQGWNRYSYVGNSPLNFTDPSGYCFMGCFWKKIGKALGKLFRKIPILGTILKVAAAFIWGPICAGLASAFVAGVTTGSWSAAFRAGLMSVAQTYAFNFIGTELELNFGSRIPEFGTTGHIMKIASHAAVGCVSAAVMGGKCGQGAIGAAVSAGASPFMPGGLLGVAASGVVGGAAAAASGGKFGAGFANAFADAATTAAFGYMYNGGKALQSLAKTGFELMTAEFKASGFSYLAKEVTFVTDSGVRTVVSHR